MYFSGGGRCARILHVMTRAHPRANWIGPPPLTELWLEALLRVAAMLWSIVAATFQTCLAVAEGRRRMSPSRPARECDTPPAPQVLPRRTRDSLKETISAAVRSHSQEALMVSSRRRRRPSNHEGGLTAARAFLPSSFFLKMEPSFF